MKLDKRACRHAANVPLHISLNAGVLYTERVKYLVTAAVKLLGGHRVLAVYFYECERLKANDRMPKWVVFQGKDTFATLERDAEGNVKWRDAMVQHLTDYYMGDFLQSCVFYKKAGCHTIARYIGAKSDPTKVLWELNWYQQDIRDQQTKIRRYKRDTVVLNKMSSVPQTPANLKRWADKHIMPHYLFYDYNNGRVKTQVYCTYCEKFSVIKRPKNNDVLRCPKCDQKVIAKAQGRRAAYYEDRETCQVVQQISPHELVVRIYKLYWSYVKGKDTTRKSAYEVMRIFVCGDDGKKATISYIAPYLETAAVNISCGYYCEHQRHEYIHLEEIELNADRVAQMVTQQTEHFEYMEQQDSFFGGRAYQYSMWDTASERDTYKWLSPLPKEAKIKLGTAELILPHAKIDRQGKVHRYVPKLKAAVLTENAIAVMPDGKKARYDFQKAKCQKVMPLSRALEILNTI